MSRRLSWIVEYGLYFLIVFPPLAFGAVYPWAYGILELVSFSVLLVWLIAARVGSYDPPFHARKNAHPLVVPFAVFVGLVLFQMLPMPPGMLKILSPQTYALYGEALDGYPRSAESEDPASGSPRTAAARLGFDVSEDEEGAIPEPKPEAIALASRDRGDSGFFRNWRSLSVYRRATRVELLKVLAYGSAFFLILSWVDCRTKLVRLLFVLIMTGLAISILGMAQRFYGAEKIYGLWKPIFRGDRSFFGSYVNPNHFAGYVALLIPLGVSLLIRQVERLKRSSPGGFGHRLRMLDSPETYTALLILLILLSMAIGLSLSGSRGGIVALVGGMIFLLAVLLAGRTRHSIVGLGLAAGLFLVLFDLWLGLVPFQSEAKIVTRLFQDPNVQERMRLWRDGWAMLMDFPLFGTGLGTFADIYPKYKTILSQTTVVYPESDVLTLLIETGFLGFGLLVWFFLSYFKTFWKLWRGRGRHVAEVNPIVMAGLAAGVVALLIHGFGDFNLHIPANALQFAIVMGLAMVVKRERGELEEQ